MSIKQQKGGTLKQLLKRFNEQQLQVQDLDEAVAMIALNNATHKECSWSLSKDPQKSFKKCWTVPMSSLEQRKTLEPREKLMMVNAITHEEIRKGRVWTKGTYREI